MRKFFGTFILGLSLTLGLFGDDATSVTDTQDYRELCYQAVINDEVFKTFKRSPIYRNVLEHVTYDQGLEYLAVIKKKYPDLLSYWDTFSQNDLIGTPMVYFYPDLGGYASPTTLRYVKIAGELKELFGSLHGKRIIELGGGYGGQCKILSDLFAFESYHHIDLPEPLALITKYLTAMQVSNTVMTASDECQEESCDLFISNFGFCECSRSAQEEYMQKYILKSKAGYMILSNAREYLTPKPFSLMEIRRELLKGGYKVKLYAEEPSTNKKNILIVWERK
ncbi:MAG: hypothetical protein CK425_01385 [Parachlamydia sp.]|nr:MAG: hypothetical protein CK425_01385 [Parachlamydia sp.]